MLKIREYIQYSLAVLFIAFLFTVSVRSNTYEKIGDIFLYLEQQNKTDNEIFNRLIIFLSLNNYPSEDMSSDGFIISFQS